MFCVIITVIWWGISNSCMTRGWPTQKNCIDNISSKSKERLNSSPSPLLIRYNTRAFWKTKSTIQEREGGTIIFWFIYQARVTGRVLVHFIDKSHVLVVTVELIRLLLLNILSFNFVQTPNKSLTLRGFRRGSVNRPAVVPNSVKIPLPFLFDVRCLKWSRSFFKFFFSGLSPMMIYLQCICVTYFYCCANVANPKVGKLAKRCEIILHILINHR